MRIHAFPPPTRTRPPPPPHAAARQVVVLSPDADLPLLQLAPDRVYVIGGIVDRTVRKNLTAKFAVRGGWYEGRGGDKGGAWWAEGGCVCVCLLMTHQVE